MDSDLMLDTHVLVWMSVEPQRLSKVAARHLKHARRRLIADITLRELALHAAAGHLAVDDSLTTWLDDLLDEHQIEVVAIDPRIAARSTRIAQNFHGDPADQLIAATAIELDVPLVTADEKLRASGALRTIW